MLGQVALALLEIGLQPRGRGVALLQRRLSVDQLLLRDLQTLRGRLGARVSARAGARRARARAAAPNSCRTAAALLLHPCRTAAALLPPCCPTAAAPFSPTARPRPRRSRPAARHQQHFRQGGTGATWGQSTHRKRGLGFVCPDRGLRAVALFQRAAIDGAAMRLLVRVVHPALCSHNTSLRGRDFAAGLGESVLDAKCLCLLLLQRLLQRSDPGVLKQRVALHVGRARLHRLRAAREHVLRLSG